MGGAEEEALRERWEFWVQHSLGGTQTQIDVATEAIMHAIAGGASQEDAVEQGRIAWSGGPAAPEASQPASAPAPGALPPAPEPSPPRSSSPDGRGVTGRVGGFQQRNEQSGRRYLSVWNFRVERPDAPPVAVEMRGFSFEGSIGEGDEVRLDANPKDGDVVRVGRLENLTSNATVRVTSRAHPVVRGIGTALTTFVKLVLFLVVLAAIAAAIYFVAKQGGS